jgi:septal ring factor EnvC (AmiA/AmiB activator)
MHFIEIAQEIAEQNERIEEIEHQFKELLEQVDRLKHEASAEFKS